MDYAALKLEVAKPAYSGLSDSATAAAVNAATVTVTVDVRARALRWLLYGRGKWPLVQKRALQVPAGTAGDVAISAARFFVALADQDDTLPVTNSDVATQLATDFGSLISAGDLVAADRTAALALKDQVRPLWSSFGPGPVQANDVMIAKAS